MKFLKFVLILFIIATALMATLWVLDLVAFAELKQVFGKTAAILGIVSLAGACMILVIRKKE